MLYTLIIAVCSEIHTKHTNTLCGQNLEFVNVKLAVHIVTTGLQITFTNVNKEARNSRNLIHIRPRSTQFHNIFNHNSDNACDYGRTLL